MSRPYSIALAGTKSYQAQIAGVGEGEAVTLVHEPDNPYDERAIAAVCHGDTIGYLPRDSWLADALLDEGKGCSIKVRRLQRGADRITGVTLEVRLGGAPIRERQFTAF